MSFYSVGDSFKWFVGNVEDVMDPLMLGRLKIRIINEQDPQEVSTDELVWAYPLTPIHSASMASQNVDGAVVSPGPTAVGWSPTGIEVGSEVYGFFMDGTEGNVPIVMGTRPKIPGASRENLSGAHEIMNHDVSKLAREEQTLEKIYVDGDHVCEPKSAYDAKYPFNKTFTTRSGHAIEIDDTEGHERIHVYHKSGSYYEINEDGRWTRKIVDDDYEIVVKDKKAYVKGNLTIEVAGDAYIDINQDAHVNVEGDMKAHIEGDADLKVDGDLTGETGGDFTWKIGEECRLVSEGRMYLEASRIDLNLGGIDAPSAEEPEIPDC